MRIERCFVAGCRVYTVFENGSRIVDDFDTPARALDEQAALLRVNDALYGKTCIWGWARPG